MKKRPGPIYSKHRTNRGVSIPIYCEIKRDKYRLLDPTHRFPKNAFIQEPERDIIMIEGHRQMLSVRVDAIRERGPIEFAFTLHQTLEGPWVMMEVCGNLDDLMARLEELFNPTPRKRGRRVPDSASKMYSP